MALRDADLPRPAVFFDKDGTLVRNVPYNVDPGQLVFYPEAASAVRLLEAVGYDLFVVSNQPGLALGLFEECDLGKIRKQVEGWFDVQSCRLVDFLYCPHHPDGMVARWAIDCDCRKPQPGMILKAARQWKIDLQHSWLIGDILDDIEAGRVAGCKTILIDNGNETKWEISPNRSPHYIASNLGEAAIIITSDVEAGPSDVSSLATVNEDSSW